MMYIKCPKCDLNYIKEEDGLCDVCKSEKNISSGNLTPNSQLSSEEIKLLIQDALSGLSDMSVRRYKSYSYQDVSQKYPHFVIMIKSGCFYDVRECSALILNRLFQYTLCCENYQSFSRIKTGFPLDSLNQVTCELKERKISYIVIDDYKIFDIYTSDNNSFLSFIELYKDS